MKKTVITFGLISGAVSALMMVVTIPFEDAIGFNHGLIIGYTTIVLSFLLVYFGVRSYRDNVGNGQITFAKAFGVGILITLISCFCYVATWEILYFHVLHGFADKYSAHIVERARLAGASAAEIQQKIQEGQKLKQTLDNPFLNSMMTFIEPFPVGLAITLISAAILRKKTPLQTAQTPLRVA